VGNADAEEIRRCIDRGLARYGRGELREAIEEWERALALDDGNAEATTLIEFVRRKLGSDQAAEDAKDNQRTTDPVLQSFSEDWTEEEDTDREDPDMRAHRLAAQRAGGQKTARHNLRQPTVESPIPEILSQMTNPQWQAAADEADEAGDGVPSAPVFGNDTRRVGSEPHSPSGGRVPAVSEYMADDASGSRLRAAELVDICRAEYERGNIDGAVSAAEKALREGDRAPAPGIPEVVEPAKELFERVFATYVGPEQGVPTLGVSPDALTDQNLDHRAGFLLSRIDGVMTIEHLFDIAGMPRFETLRILASLLRVNAIRMM